MINHIIQMNNNFTACVQNVRHQHAHDFRRSHHWSFAALITFWSQTKFASSVFAGHQYHKS